MRLFGSHDSGNFRYTTDIKANAKRRVHKILAELNTEIHKSVNQFIVDAVDFYIRSLNDESLVKETGEPKKMQGTLQGMIWTAYGRN